MGYQACGVTPFFPAPGVNSEEGDNGKQGLYFPLPPGMNIFTWMGLRVLLSFFFCQSSKEHHLEPATTWQLGEIGPMQNNCRNSHYYWLYSVSPALGYLCLQVQIYIQLIADQAFQYHIFIMQSLAWRKKSRQGSKAASKPRVSGQ